MSECKSRCNPADQPADVGGEIDIAFKKRKTDIDDDKADEIGSESLLGFSIHLGQHVEVGRDDAEDGAGRTEGRIVAEQNRERGSRYAGEKVDYDKPFRPEKEFGELSEDIQAEHIEK